MRGSGPTRVQRREVGDVRAAHGRVGTEGDRVAVGLVSGGRDRTAVDGGRARRIGGQARDGSRGADRPNEGRRAGRVDRQAVIRDGGEQARVVDLHEGRAGEALRDGLIEDHADGLTGERAQVHTRGQIPGVEVLRPGRGGEDVRAEQIRPAAERLDDDVEKPGDAGAAEILHVPGGPVVECESRRPSRDDDVLREPDVSRPVPVEPIDRGEAPVRWGRGEETEPGAEPTPTHCQRGEGTGQVGCDPPGIVPSLETSVRQQLRGTSTAARVYGSIERDVRAGCGRVRTEENGPVVILVATRDDRAAVEGDGLGGERQCGPGSRQVQRGIHGDRVGVVLAVDG